MDMELTQTFLRGKNPCAMGYRWFVRNNLSGGDYQTAMDTQVAAGRVDDARWLLENFRQHQCRAGAGAPGGR